MTLGYFPHSLFHQKIPTKLARVALLHKNQQQFLKGGLGESMVKWFTFGIVKIHFY